MSMTDKASDSLAEQIARYLAERIIRGDLKAGERIQEIRVTQALNVSRGSVREALLILQRRHLVDILPRRGAQVASLDPQKVRSLYDLMIELYIMVANAVADRWSGQQDLQPMRDIQQGLRDSVARNDLKAFIEHSFTSLRSGYPFAANPYLQETIENLQPAISRTYHVALEQRRSRMGEFLNGLVELLDAIEARDKPRIRRILEEYCQQNCQLVLEALAARPRFR